MPSYRRTHATNETQLYVDNFKHRFRLKRQLQGRAKSRPPPCLSVAEKCSLPANYTSRLPLRPVRFVEKKRRKVVVLWFTLSSLCTRAEPTPELSALLPLAPHALGFVCVGKAQIGGVGAVCEHNGFARVSPPQHDVGGMSPVIVCRVCISQPYSRKMWTLSTAPLDPPDAGRCFRTQTNLEKKSVPTIQSLCLQPCQLTTSFDVLSKRQGERENMSTFFL